MHLLLAAVMLGAPVNDASQAQAAILQRDGSHDFDFLIGDWRAHVRRLPERLVGSNSWVEYDGISNHKKLLDTSANFEEFDVRSADGKLRIKAQTLRMYNGAVQPAALEGARGARSLRLAKPLAQGRAHGAGLLC